MKISPHSCYNTDVSCELRPHNFFDESISTLIIFNYSTSLYDFVLFFLSQKFGTNPLNTWNRNFFSRFLFQVLKPSESRIPMRFLRVFFKLGTWISYGGECRGTHPPYFDRGSLNLYTRSRAPRQDEFHYFPSRKQLLDRKHSTSHHVRSRTLDCPTGHGRYTSNVRPINVCNALLQPICDYAPTLWRQQA